MRSLREISVGNGWYWLAGAAIAYAAVWAYVAFLSPILPVLAWHGTHSRTMHFADFHLDVPLFWYVPKAGVQQLNDISSVGIYKAVFPRQIVGSIVLSKSRAGSCTGCFERDREVWVKMYGPSNATPITYPLAYDSMDCVYHEISQSFVTMSCISDRTGSALEFFGSKQDYLKLHDIVH